MREMEISGLAAAIDGLPERQRYVLVRRYALGVDEDATLAEISDEPEVSKERVQLQREAERMLREAITNRPSGSGLGKGFRSTAASPLVGYWSP